MTELIILRGIAGSGKSTWAAEWVSERKDSRARIGRDFLRHQLYGTYTGLSGEQENAVTVAQKASVRALLRAGRSVVVDDTNLYLPAARDWADIAVEEGVDWTVREFDVPLDVCLARNAARDRVVPESVIRKMHDKFVNRKVIESRLGPVEKYVPDESLPKAFVFDIDNTLAMNVGRSPYDYSRVSEDALNMEVAEMAKRLYDLEYKIIIMSGREDWCRSDTESWLSNNGIQYNELHMRASKDGRKDSVVKQELFESKIAPNYCVKAVFDDRDQVVKMYRNKGLPVYQVNYGDF